MVLILDSSLPRFGAPSRATDIGDVLAARGIESRRIGDDDILRLDAEQRGAILVLPNAAAFPLAALPVLRTFLRGGGHLISLGGLLLEHLYARDAAGGSWREQSTICPSLLANGDLGRMSADGTPEGWLRKDPRRCTVEECEIDGRRLRSLRMEVARADLDRSDGAGPDPSAEWSCEAGGCEPGATYVLSALMRSEGVGARHFAHFHWTYLRVEQQDAGGTPLHSMLLDFEHPYLTGTEPWRTMRYRFWPVVGAERLVVRVGIKGGAWGALWAADLRLELEEWPTTAVGMLCDGLHTLPHQIGAFDPSFRLSAVSRIATSARQPIVTAAIDAQIPVSGYAAVASTGEEPPLGATHIGRPRTVRRLTPLLEAFDVHGRPRGPVLSLVHNFAGQYEGSVWALLGVESSDLLVSVPGFADALAQVVRHLQEGVFLCTASPAFACYRTGERVTMNIEAKCARGFPVEAAIRCEVRDREERLAWSGERTVTLAPGGATTRVEIACDAFELVADLYRASTRLFVSGREVDGLEAGFVVWKPDLLAAGRDIDFRDNYFRLNGRPTLVCGTKGGVFWLDRHPSEDPLAWDAECAALRDHGLAVYGMVGLSQWVTLEQEPDEREWRLRRLDARVQLCHHHGIVPFIDLQFHPVAGVDRDAEIAYARTIAERYRQLRTLFFYVTGDITVPLSDDPGMREAFHAYLRGKYGTAEAVTAAWGAPLARIEDARVEPMKAYWQRRGWHDVRAADLHAFRNRYLHDWLDRQAAALRRVSAAAGTRLITAEFWSDQQLDQWNASTGLDFSAMGIGLGQRRYMHRYDAPMLRLADLRSVGQSFTIGEFGTQVHPAFDHAGYSWSDERGKLERFALVVHHAFGLGGSMIATWDAADLDYYLFPWGLLHGDRRTRKPILPAYRGFNLFFRQLQPAWQQPDTLLVLPDENRRSGNFHLVTEALFNAARMLVQCRVDAATLNDGSLARLDHVPRAIFYPVPFCSDDAPLAALRALVEAGAHLYLSGDVSCDPLRRRTRTDRLEDLAGVRFMRERWPGIAWAGEPAVRITRAGEGQRVSYEGRPCIDVEPLSARPAWVAGDGCPVAFRRSLGRGSVFFSTDPIELYSHGEDAAGNRRRRAVYEDVLKGAGVTRHPVTAGDEVSSFHLPQVGGGHAYVFFNQEMERDTPAAVRLRLPDSSVEFDVAPCRGGCVVLDGSGAFIGWEGRGTLRVNGEPWFAADGDILVYSADRRSLGRSDALVVLPMAAGSLKIHRQVHAAGGWSAIVGEPVGGAWRTMRILDLERVGGAAVLRWSALDAEGILVVGRTDRFPLAVESVVADLHR